MMGISESKREVTWDDLLEAFGYERDKHSMRSLPQRLASVLSLLLRREGYTLKEVIMTR